MKNKFYTKNGWLTPYAMACGYLHQCEIEGVTYRMELVNSEINLFLVERATWDAELRNPKYHHSIKAARADYKARVGELKYRFDYRPDKVYFVIE